MKGSSFYPVLVVVIVFNAFQLTTSLPAQSIWLDNDKGNSIAVEILKPEFAQDDGYTFLSSAIFVSGRYSLDENIVLVAELPFAHSEYEPNIIATVPFDYYYENYNNYETIIGNPYFGIEIRTEELPVFGEFGIRLPLSTEIKHHATNVGSSSDYDRYNAFVPDGFIFTSKGNYCFNYTPNFSNWLRLGPTILFYSKDPELWIYYSEQFKYKHNNVNVIFGLSGRFLVSKSNLQNNQRITHHLGIAASAGFGIIRPGLHFRYPIYGNDLIKFIYGLNFSVQIP